VITTSAYEGLPGGTRRRLLRCALVRPTLSAASLFILYFTLPLDRSFSALTVLALFAGLGIFAVLIAFQTRAIVRSPYPRLTAITSLAFSAPIFLLCFATVYYLMERSDPSAFTESMTRMDALYFTVTVFTTVGFGDIAARSELARAITTIQMLGDLLLIGLVARVLLSAVQTGLASRVASSETAAPDSADPSADS
jgi:voltage-gated potassium channel